MGNQNPVQAASPAQPLPWYGDRVEAVRKEYVNPWAEEDAHPADGRTPDRPEQYKAHIRLTPQKRRELACRTGLGVRGMENQIRRLVDDAIKSGAYNHVPDEEYARMPETMKFISSMWCYADEPGEAPQKSEMNVLMLLANAIEALSMFNVQYQMDEPQQP